MAVYVKAMDVDAIDGWTFAHGGAGALAGYVRFPFLLTMAAALAWEGIENYNWPQRTIPFFATERPLNMVADILVTGAGWILGRLLRESR